MQDNAMVPYVLGTKASRFLKEHENIFPTVDETNMQGFIDAAIEYKHVEKTPEEYGDKLMEVPELYVMSIEEVEIGEGAKITTIETADVQGNHYYILYKGIVDGVFKEDIIKANILPLGITGYYNVSGGTTTTLVTAGALIRKVEMAEE